MSTDVVLLPLRQQSAAVFAADAFSFAASSGFSLGPCWPESSEDVIRTATFLASVGGTPPWGAYLAIDKLLRRLVGVCAFKGDPDRDHAVEICYFTVPSEEGRGVATGMARALLGVARTEFLRGRANAPAMARAHTQPFFNPSTRVLEKTGFRRVGEVIDPEDGLVWRWARTLDVRPPG